jgi:aconitate hydratase
MENTRSFISAARLTTGNASLRLVDLPGMFGETLYRLPVVLRLLLENVIRNTNGDERELAVEGIVEWLENGTSEVEIAFQPDRVLMHDTTSTPALVDIAAMRDALAEAGADPGALNPVLPVDASVDHSLAVEYFARPDSAPMNLQQELRPNAERYRFLRWASRALTGVRIHPPGTGIMHTINLEQLATVVSVQERDGERWAVPDTLIGTDSHTPMINGIGVLGWGVGGLEAQTVMFGMHVMQRIPDVVGVRLTGALKPGALATDLALTVTQRLRAIGVAGEFVEFFGPGVATLTAGERSVVANMAPEYGASTGFFPVDQTTLDYLRATNRNAAAITLVEVFTKRAGLWFDPSAEPVFTRTIEIDLNAIGMHVAGPRRPQDLLDYSATSAALDTLAFTPQANELHEHVGPRPAHRRRARGPQSAQAGPDGAALGQDLAWARLARSSVVSGAGRAHRRSVGTGFRYSGLWLHHVHRQFRPAHRTRESCACRQGNLSGCDVVREQEFPRPYSSRSGSRLHHVAASGRRICAVR